ncbi:unnamed protein product [Somion occarium]|uniref:AB hydrolase-1 domain-containing protein n=1 Tax=Somion occarium TaxID=3059160 RepID=A0ABP1CQ50_9APHY
MASSMHCQSYVFDPRPRYPLQLTAKRYWIPSENALLSNDSDALTLIFTHGTGFHKEIWEPTIEHLFDVIANENNNGRSGQRVKIREVWSVDAPDHGDAAILNEKVLQWGYSEVVSWEEHARSLHAFLTGLGTGVDVDFSTHNLVGVGHSMGAVSLILSETYMPELRFSSMILVEPMIVPEPPKAFKERLSAGFLISAAQRRRDVFPSREEATKYVQNSGVSKHWDPRVQKVFVKHGLRQLPTAEYPKLTEGVTLKCSKVMEIACYKDALGRTRAFQRLHLLCSQIPVHFVYGVINDQVPGVVKENFLTVGAKGRHASVTRIDGAGHLVPHMQPQRLGRALMEILQCRPASKVAEATEAPENTKLPHGHEKQFEAQAQASLRGHLRSFL